MNDNPPAFPQQEWNTTFRGQVADEGWGGMSLRDYFAGQALAGGAGKNWRPEKRAELCYEMADAMLEARKVQS